MGGGENKGVVAKVEPMGLGNVFMTNDCSKSPGDCMSVATAMDYAIAEAKIPSADMAKIITWMDFRDAQRKLMGIRSGSGTGSSYAAGEWVVGIGLGVLGCTSTRNIFAPRPYIEVVEPIPGVMKFSLSDKVQIYKVADAAVVKEMCKDLACGFSKCRNKDTLQEILGELKMAAMEARLGALVESLSLEVRSLQATRDRLATQSPSPSDLARQLAALDGQIMVARQHALKPLAETATDYLDFTGYAFATFEACPDVDGRAQVRMVVGRSTVPAAPAAPAGP